ncbi:MAG: PAS domain-containing sensor histidine kinase [Rhodospirillaceae bacterium]
MTKPADQQSPLPMSIAEAFKIRGASAKRKLAYGLAAAAVLSCLATAFILIAEPVDTRDVETVIAMIYLDGALLLLLGLVVGQRLFSIWRDRHRGQAGSGLHGRMVLLFSLVATAPAILVAVMSATFLHYGVQAWFNNRVSTALERSMDVTTAYLKEHRENLGTDIVAVADDLNFNAQVLIREPWRLEGVLSFHARSRGFTEAVMVDGSGKVIGQSELGPFRDTEIIPQHVVDQAKNGKIGQIPIDDADRTRAIYKLNRFVDRYLVVERFVNPVVLRHINLIRNAVTEYRRLQKERGGLQVSFILIFTVVSMLLLLAAIWTGLTVATQLTDPVVHLISAAERMRDGDLATTVDIPDAEDELATLSRAFNQMTAQIRGQQEGLISANRELDERRRFTETVLAGVSAGVIGLDAQGRVNLPNRSASDLLGQDIKDAKGQALADVVPEFALLIQAAMRRPNRQHSGEVTLNRGEVVRTLLLRVAAERLGGEIIGFVVTFDNLTELLSAQRAAAWADVARRIAHEIKNPLTPIQLSAERLKRKYQGEIKTDPETFATCTETIVRQVEDIGRMVDEFSSFARMPRATMETENLGKLVKDVVFLEKIRNPNIELTDKYPDHDVMLRCDRRQVTRALTNILKNAIEAVESRMAHVAEIANEGRVVLTVEDDRSTDEANGAIRVIVEDNGKGLPVEDRERLTEPYVTTRSKGTGLGLAIVHKIMEDHDGQLILEDRPGGGARITLVFGDLDEFEHGGEGKKEDEVDPMKVATAIGIKTV